MEKRKNKVIYMAVDDSELELPIAVADSPAELAKMLGLKRNTISAEICRFKSGKTQGRKKQTFFKIEIDDQTT